MKLSTLSPEQKTKLLAELDGWLDVMEYTFDYDWMGEKGKHKQWLGRNTKCLQDLKFLRPYLTSYDAIIPLIQKLELASKITPTCYGYETPPQLCDALLVATGKATI